MPMEIQALDGVPESSLKNIIKQFAQTGANIITAINEGGGDFSVEATFIDPDSQSITKTGKMSTFGGPHDMTMTSFEGLALYDPTDIKAAPAGLFLGSQPPETIGLGRRLNPAFNYLACRWDYALTPADFLRRNPVTVSANGKSVTACVADFGPNVRTGRIADLSPGLAHALGLNTDDECTVVIPLPPNANIQIPAAAPAVGVDLVSIDAMLFPADMTRTLVVMTTTDKTTYWVVNLTGANEGGQTLMRKVADNPPESLRSATVILPLKAGDAVVPATVAGELNKAVQKELDVHTGPDGTAPGPGDDINAKMFTTARAFVGHDTSQVPGTSRGTLACAWCVNQLARLALGKPISSEAGKNGLSTDGLFDALNASHTRLGSAAEAVPGTVIIAPTVGDNHGHTGIVGATNGDVESTQVFSNSSSAGKFMQNYTIGSFTRHFKGKALEVLFFALKPGPFL